MATVAALGMCCPGCRTPLDTMECHGCGCSFPDVAGIPDLRLMSDRYLSIDAERAKAERLARIAAETDLAGVARAYYDITDDVDPARCRKFLAHIMAAEARGEAVADALQNCDGPMLELGCGTGGLLVAAARRGWGITGVDIASRWLVVARRRLEDCGVEVQLLAASAETLPWPDGQFATIVADSLIEHLDDPLAALKEWRRLLRPGGRLVLWSPNRLSLAGDPHVRLWGIGFLPRSWADHYSRLRRGGAWVPRTLTASGVARLACEAGFRDVRTSIPCVSDTWVGSVRGMRGRLLKIYQKAQDYSIIKSFLKTLGPLWTLEARA